MKPFDPFTIDATVANSGQTAAESSTLHYYLSTNIIITVFDHLLGSDPIGSVGAGGRARVSLTVEAPEIPDTYWIGACVDSVPGESDYGNNCSSARKIEVSYLIFRDDFDSGGTGMWSGGRGQSRDFENGLPGD